MTVKDIMRSPVITVHQNASLQQAIAILSTRGVSGLPVLDDAGDMVGIVTEHDLIRAMLPTYEDIASSDAALLSGNLMQMRVFAVRDNPVASIMTRNVVAVTEDTTILKAASTVILRKIKRLPVVRGNKPVGIVSRIDIAQAITQGGS
jgi:CBS domain-containing protein